MKMKTTNFLLLIGMLILIQFNSTGAPAVRGREGAIWGTGIAPYGFTILGFGSSVASPWRAGANESTTISFSTDVTINGKPLAAGKYGFFIALYADSSTLIFNKNTVGWGSYFYNGEMDVARIGTRQQKEMKESKERLDFVFSNQTDRAVEVALEWERWRIPFKVETDLTKNTLASIRSQMTGALGFDPPSLEAAAAWCLRNNVNYKGRLARKIKQERSSRANDARSIAQCQCHGDACLRSSIAC